MHPNCHSQPPPCRLLIDSCQSPLGGAERVPCTPCHLLGDWGLLWFMFFSRGIPGTAPVSCLRRAQEGGCSPARTVMWKGTGKGWRLCHRSCELHLSGLVPCLFTKGGRFPAGCFPGAIFNSQPFVPRYRPAGVRQPQPRGAPVATGMAPSPPRWGRNRGRWQLGATRHEDSSECPPCWCWHLQQGLSAMLLLSARPRPGAARRWRGRGSAPAEFKARPCPDSHPHLQAVPSTLGSLQPYRQPHVLQGHRSRAGGKHWPEDERLG